MGLLNTSGENDNNIFSKEHWDTLVLENILLRQNKLSKRINWLINGLPL